MDLNQLAKELAHTLSASFSRKIGVDLDLSPGLPSVLGEPSQIHQVAMNLVINAAQAIGESEGTIRIRTSTVELRNQDLRNRFAEQQLAPGDYVLLEVSDTGAGMTPDTLQRIFDPFFMRKSHAFWRAPATSTQTSKKSTWAS